MRLGMLTQSVAVCPGMIPPRTGGRDWTSLSFRLPRQVPTRSFRTWHVQFVVCNEGDVTETTLDSTGLLILLAQAQATGRFFH